MHTRRKRLILQFLAAISALWLFSLSCSQPQNNSEGTGEGDAFSPLSYAEGDTLNSFPSTVINDWFAYHHLSDTGFRRGAFLASGINIRIDSLPSCLMPDSSTMVSLASLLAWSPDSTHAIDIWSYGFQPRRSTNGTLMLEGGGPDQMVKLIDHSNRHARQLLFNGPSQVVEVAGWPARNAIVLGLLNIDPSTGEATPDLVLIHLGDSLFTNFRYAGPRIPASGRFTQTWLKAKGIQTE